MSPNHTYQIAHYKAKAPYCQHLKNTRLPNVKVNSDQRASSSLIQIHTHKKCARHGNDVLFAKKKRYILNYLVHISVNTWSESYEYESIIFYLKW